MYTSNQHQHLQLSTGSVIRQSVGCNPREAAYQMRRESAAWLNANQITWKVHGDYTDGRQPNPIKKGDRVFNGDCSSVTKRLGDGDIEGAIEALWAVANGGV